MTHVPFYTLPVQFEDLPSKYHHVIVPMFPDFLREGTICIFLIYFTKTSINTIVAIALVEVSVWNFINELKECSRIENDFTPIFAYVNVSEAYEDLKSDADGSTNKDNNNNDEQDNDTNEYEDKVIKILKEKYPEVFEPHNGSRKLTISEINITVLEKELLSIVHALKVNYYLLIGHE
ncbi:hypothetical protein PPL_03980 [Heterostelium album PN500]|uniref:Uncharacterized protein n=1 Tax=Heterostelium pallidum (strain ATCC 26659 / Pp 5 / PN500) TaxID=670386 RepID=D3B5P2_HETP5|nr:hypothetical protein PPL_03980 [Heterostelium album PN500]EFA83190.1 hypothetical protein PPL_03980 [Heterostelium album PN500]|eukprot:XP_020435307.1 hypothetical protein PPL_03980 [Heterostelium album PN500]